MFCEEAKKIKCLFSLQLLYSVENYISNVQDSLDYLHKEVNVATHLDICWCHLLFIIN